MPYGEATSLKGAAPNLWTGTQKTVLCANLAETRIGEHHRTVRQLGNGTQLIVVDPVQSVLAKKARIWLQLTPGTDLALALGILHVIINEKM